MTNTTNGRRPSAPPPPPTRMTPPPPPGRMSSATPNSPKTQLTMSSTADTIIKPAVNNNSMPTTAYPTPIAPGSKSKTMAPSAAMPPPSLGHISGKTGEAANNASRFKRSPGAPTLETIIKKAFDEGYSDVHVGVGEIPRYRDRGEILTTDHPVTDKATFFSWLEEILQPQDIETFQETLDFDGAADYPFARIRINIFDSLLGPAMVLRLIPKKILTMEQLKSPAIFKDICHYHKGLILITGPTGSGKSTTMAAMIDYMNREMPKHIITIEDPIEFVHQSQKSLIKQREVGEHTQKFDSALKAALREDPDLILVGEMRDKETVNTALKAAQTGHLVMGTLHTNSAVKTIERVLNLYEPEQQPPMRTALAESLVAVIAQGLCRTTDGKRAAFHDIMINTDAIKDYILRGDLDKIQELIPNCGFDGMRTMNQSLYSLYEAGRITEETALEKSPTPNEMAQMLRGRV